jgi:uncharacterized protein (DUF4415 family)
VDSPVPDSDATNAERFDPEGPAERSPDNGVGVCRAETPENFRSQPGQKPKTRETLMRKEYAFSMARRAAGIARVSGKTRITIRLDDDLVAWFKSQVNAAGRGNYQSLINAALRYHMNRQKVTGNHPTPGAS